MSIYCCTNDERKEQVKRIGTLNGIDYLEVDAHNQTILHVHFVHPLPGQLGEVPQGAVELTHLNFKINGGVRIRNIKVDNVSVIDNVITLKVVEATNPDVSSKIIGDLSFYELILVSGPDSESTPTGFDPHLSRVSFTFKAECPKEFDCKPEDSCITDFLTDPKLSYMAKDYASFRALLLERMRLTMPDWQERSTADLQIALVELLAYVGDNLSYYQDAVATEAYLGTSRKRISVRRHARLLDYVMHEGTNARAFICFEISSAASGAVKIPKGSQLLSGADSLVPLMSAKEFSELKGQLCVFETMSDLDAYSANNFILFYTWSARNCCLPKGTTQAYLNATGNPQLKAGDLLAFEEYRSPDHGVNAEANRAKRHVVRLTSVFETQDPLTNTKLLHIKWHVEDALPFEFVVSAETSPTGYHEDITVARGNIGMADNGLLIRDEELPTVVSGRKYKATLKQRGLVFRHLVDHDEMKLRSAFESAIQDLRQTQAAVSLSAQNDEWTSVSNLLNSDDEDLEFVVEMENDRTAILRFGDNVHGKRPDDGLKFKATYRIGDGKLANVGADAITSIVSSDSAILSVRNPLPAVGGRDPESIEEVKQFAPQAFRTQERAVTTDDYENFAVQYPQTQRAHAAFRWTGSWHTVYLSADRLEASNQQSRDAYAAGMLKHLNRYRLAGYDLELRDPLFVPLEIAMKVCVHTGYFRSEVKAELLKVFSNKTLPTGELGFFNSNSLTFGQSIYLSQLYRAAMRVSGVKSVDVTMFQRFGKLANQELANGVIEAAEHEILRLDNDPNFPEHGIIRFEMAGGL